MVRVTAERRKIHTPAALESILLSDPIFANIAGIESKGLNDTFTLLTGISVSGSTLWRADLINQSDTAASQEEIAALKKQIQKYNRAKERLEDAYYFSDDAMSEKEYLEKKNKFDAARVAAENKLKELTEVQISSHVDDTGFMKSASSFLLAHQIHAGAHIEYREFAATIEEETLKEFLNIVLDHISVKDRRVVEIVFSNGLSHRFIYRE